MNLSDILSKDLILLDFRAKDHTAALREMVCLLGENYCDAGFLKELRDHESIDGVLSGANSAIFHALSEFTDDIKTVIAVSAKGIPHPKRKKEKINIIFLIISPIKESGTHLQLLSKLEGFLINRIFRRRLLEAKSKEKVVEIIKKEEGLGRNIFIPLTEAEVFSELNTASTGLTDEEARRRLKAVGPNVLKKVKTGRLLYDFIRNLTNLFAMLLWAGGILAFIGGMPELGWAIFAVIIINACFSFWQEYKAERAIDALKKLLPHTVKVLRNGSEKNIPVSAIVHGDIILLREGDAIPSDGRLVAADDMRVDNSALTGESRPVYKVSGSLENGKNFIWTEMPNLVFAGTTILSGIGKAVVTATGMDTEIGKVAYLTQAIGDEPSPLQKEMTRVTKVVTWIALTLGVVFFLLGYKIVGLTLVESFIFAVGIIVANVPEGLLPTVSLSLAMGVQRMAKKKAIVKKLSSVETLGSATVICTDKTGTLTKGEMFAKKLLVGDKEFLVTGDGYEPKGDFIHKGDVVKKKDLKKEGIEELLKAVTLCNNAHIAEPTEERPLRSVMGDPTEASLIVLADKADLQKEELENRHPRIAHLAFERIRKRMTTIHKFNESLIAYTKGAPKEMLSLCKSIKIDGQVVPLTKEEREKILILNDSMAKEGLRVLAAGEREVDKKPSYTVEEVEKNITFLGLIGILDAPREEVKDSISECHSAGIRVIMMTGDYGLTAETIAKEVGIGGHSPKVITGVELKRLSHRELMEVLKKGEVVFARVEPEDKLRVVTALKEMNEVVIVTGDGVNDAPALKKADIGIAMGIRGSDVAKESSDIILMDDNFATIVVAIREGRAAYANIKKFVTYIFASNIPEIVPFIAYVLFKIPLPLTVMQILAVDLGTDVAPALGLGVEEPESGIMKDAPRPREKKLLDLHLLSRAYFFLGPIEAILCMSGFFFVYLMNGWQPGLPMAASGIVYTTATTMTLGGIIASQIGNVFACRTESHSVFTAGFFKNRLIILGIIAEIALFLFITYTPFMQKVFGVSPLGSKEWMFLLFFPPAVLFLEETRKRLTYRRQR